jgi:hypothetical protein
MPDHGFGGGVMVALHSPWRWPTAALLLLIAAVHVPLIGDHLEEAPYVGVLFILLVVACVLLAVAVLVADAPVIWAACAVMSVLALLAFLASRTVGLPLLDDDVGNWTEPLGYPAVAAELACAGAAAAVLRRARARRAADSKVFR